LRGNRVNTSSSGDAAQDVSRENPDMPAAFIL